MTDQHLYFDPDCQCTKCQQHPERKPSHAERQKADADEQRERNLPNWKRGPDDYRSVSGR